VRIRWRVRERGAFSGEYLSAPNRNRVFRGRAVRARPQGSPRCAAPGPAARPADQDAIPGAGVLRQRERVEPPGRLRGFLARLADERVLPPASASRFRSFGCCTIGTSPAGFASESAIVSSPWGPLPRGFCSRQGADYLEASTGSSTRAPELRISIRILGAGNELDESRPIRSRASF